LKPSTYLVVSSLPGRLYIMPKPSGEWLQEDAKHYCDLGIITIVSMLEREEETELNLENERKICEQNNMEFVQLSVIDRGLPAIQPFKDLIKLIVSRVKSGGTVAVHCRAGIGRSGMTVCCSLLHFGYSSASAIEHVSNARGVLVPDTDEQIDFIHQFELNMKKA